MQKIIKRVTGFIRDGKPMVVVNTNRSFGIRPLTVFIEELRRGEFKYEKQPASATKRVAN